MKIQFKLMFSALLCLSVFACQKDAFKNDFSAEDNALSTQTFDNTDELTEEAATFGAVGSLLSVGKDGTVNAPEGCATVTRDTVSNPKTMVIDFGTTNCTGNDGRTRRGRILVSYTGRYRDAGTVITTTFDNYFVNDNQVLGTKVVTNNGRNANNNLNYTINVTGEIRSAAGDTITWTSTRNREWLLGSATLLVRQDDVYSITGSGSGTRKSGTTYTWTIGTALRKATACKWIDTGVINITPQGKTTRSLDFGSGTCDNDATVTVGSTVKSIKLK